MVWPINDAKSYVGETGKSMKAVELAVAPEDSCCKISISPIDPAIRSEVRVMSARLKERGDFPDADELEHLRLVQGPLLAVHRGPNGC